MKLFQIFKCTGELLAVTNDEGLALQMRSEHCYYKTHRTKKRRFLKP
jgi:hypothetical protein